MDFFLVQNACPVLNTPDFKSIFGGSLSCKIPVNEKGHPFAFEFVALPDMCFKVIRFISDQIIQIQWKEYSQFPLFLDRRFGIFCKDYIEYKPIQPSFDSILSRMEQSIGSSYVWGGNWKAGIPELLDFYPPSGKLDNRNEELWILKGLDCSGLLFEATSGLTPRNTSHLLHFGKSTALSSLEDLSSLLPLDMIIYPGHVLFVRDKNSIIESKSPFGVRIYPLEQRLTEIFKEFHFCQHWPPPDTLFRYFTIRRFLAKKSS